MQFDFGFAPRPALRLVKIEEILRRSRMVTPIPSRFNLIELIQAGVLEAKLTPYGWIVYEDSFKRWVEETFKPDEKQIAA